MSLSNGDELDGAAGDVERVLETKGGLTSMMISKRVIETSESLT
jgi:hypothetical protein